MTHSVVSRTAPISRRLNWPVFARWQLTLLSALLLTLFYNEPILHSLNSMASGNVTPQVLLLLLGINILLCQLFAFGRWQKPWLLLLFMLSAGSQYFMLQYGIVLDKDMLINVLETDSHEALALFNVHMLVYFSCYLLLPGYLLLRVPLNGKNGSVWSGYLGALAASLLIITLLVVCQYQLYAGTFRQHREFKHLALPLSALSASVSLAKAQAQQFTAQEFARYAEDAHMVPAISSKPKLIIMVLGETVRADHLGINGYSRNTTPRLSKRKLINFGAIDSCGTATAISVPCMFSYLTKQNYDAQLARNSDNALDVLQRAGVKVIWRDNNSGCKGVCDRVEQDQQFGQHSAYQCPDGECPDLALLNGLTDRIAHSAAAGQPVLVVLHQQGNHGPEYYKRSLEQHKTFLPECQNNLLHQCEQQHIINAYDNAIVATDQLLDDSISLLQQLNDKYDTALLYVSDHGESLGENGIYLHGLPYWLAPPAQTRVPFFMWLSDGMTQQLAVTSDCVGGNSKLNHDYLFDSLLSLYSVQTNVFRQQYDVLGRCHAAS